MYMYASIEINSVYTNMHGSLHVVEKSVKFVEISLL